MPIYQLHHHMRVRVIGVIWSQQDRMPLRMKFPHPPEALPLDFSNLVFPGKMEQTVHSQSQRPEPVLQLRRAEGLREIILEAAHGED